MDERIYARGLYHETKDNILVIQEQLDDIKKAMIKVINADSVDTTSLKNLADEYKQKTNEVAKKWKEVNELKSIWSFK